MLIKLLVVIFISTSLGGCFSSSPKSRVIIVEKSINQHNINQTRLASEVISNKQAKKTTSKNKISKKSWSIPVAGKVLKTFSKKHQGLTFNTKPGQTVRAIRDGAVVYGSAYGEMQATADIVGAIDAQEPISPTAFQNSVYNTAPSYFSLLHKNKSEILTISRL